MVAAWSKARFVALGPLVAGILVAPLMVTQSLSHADDAAPAAAVLLTNDGLLPYHPDASIAVVTATEPEPLGVPDGPPGADAWAGETVVDLGPALPAALGELAPVPPEVLSADDGEPGLAAEYFAGPDLTQAAGQGRAPWAVRDGARADGAPAVRWSGVLTAPAEGRYELALAGSGSGRLVVDGSEVTLAETAETAETAEISGKTEPDEAQATGAPADTAPVPHSATVELDLAAGGQVPVVIEHIDDGAHPLAALVWRAPQAFTPAAVAEALEVAAAADVVVVHVPAAGEAAAEQPGRLPVEHADLVRRLAEVNPRLVVVLDAAADPTLMAWLADAAAVLHVPTGSADAVQVDAVLSGQVRPDGVLPGPLPSPGEEEDPPEQDAPEWTLPAGHGLTYEPAPDTQTPSPKDEPEIEVPTGGPGDGPTSEAPTTEPVAAAPTAEASEEPQVSPAPDADGELAPTSRPAPSRPDAPAVDRVSGPEATGLFVSVSAGAGVLGDAQFLAEGWQLRGSLPTVTVVDTRDHAGAAAGWTVSARMSDLDGVSAVLPAGSVGWTPTVPAGISAGPTVPPVLSGGPGLAEPVVLGSAMGQARRGPTKLGADLVLETGYDTAPGSYAGTMTITIFPAEDD